jgi:hypothetical protein
MKWLKRIGYLILAAITGFVFASIMHTQSVLAKLTEIDIRISVSERWFATWQDLIGLAPTYGIIIFVALTLAFSITGLINKKIKASPRVLYPIAGGAAFFIMLTAMQPILDVTLIAGARGVVGLLLQVSAGVIAGVCFAQLLKQPSH